MASLSTMQVFFCTTLLLDTKQLLGYTKYYRTSNHLVSLSLGKKKSRRISPPAAAYLMFANALCVGSIHSIRSINAAIFKLPKLFSSASRIWSNMISSAFSASYATFSVSLEARAAAIESEDVSTEVQPFGVVFSMPISYGMK